MYIIIKQKNMEMQLIENRIIIVREKQIILDSDVAEIYGVETKRVNEAVKNNPDKFPEGYIIYLTNSDLSDFRSKISTTKFSKTRVAPKGFSEKGLYMLATILKSPGAIPHYIPVTRTIRQSTAKVDDAEKW
jgi:hypothetical protein